MGRDLGRCAMLNIIKVEEKRFGLALSNFLLFISHSGHFCEVHFLAAILLLKKKTVHSLLPESGFQRIMLTGRICDLDFK